MREDAKAGRQPERLPRHPEAGPKGSLPFLQGTTALNGRAYEAAYAARVWGSGAISEP